MPTPKESYWYSGRCPLVGSKTGVLYNDVVMEHELGFLRWLNEGVAAGNFAMPHLNIIDNEVVYFWDIDEALPISVLQVDTYFQVQRSANPGFVASDIVCTGMAHPEGGYCVRITLADAGNWTPTICGVALDALHNLFAADWMYGPGPITEPEMVLPYLDAYLHTGPPYILMDIGRDDFFPTLADAENFAVVLGSHIEDNVAVV